MLEKYTFRCKDCGSKKFVKEGDNVYVCAYCGYREIVNFSDKKKTESEDEPVKNEEVALQQNESSEKPSDENKSSGNSKSILSVIFNIDFFKMLICILCGMFGVHKFIEGKIIWGLIYFFTLGLFLMGYIVDIIVSILRYIQSVITGLKNL
jgi:TM2 domain-containing membrane protein YozV/ribosomal protein L37E